MSLEIYEITEKVTAFRAIALAIKQRRRNCAHWSVRAALGW